MPSRLPVNTASNSFNLTSLLQTLPSSASRSPESFTTCSACLFSTSTSLQMKRGGKKKPNERKDPYREIQAQQRKTANLAKRKKLLVERAAALGDPIRSKPTPFLTSLNLATNPAGATTTTGESYINYQLTPQLKEEQLQHSKWLTEPLRRQDGVEDEQVYQRRQSEHEAKFQNADRAISHITNLTNSSSKDRTRINVQRCIETFGRHTTDEILPPKPASLGPSRSTPNLEDLEAPTPEETRRSELLAELASVPKRVGPDTGSSEVQIAILTAKINVLANDLHGQDKVNKRNLRLLVHRRQALLKYLRRKERGGPRWQNLVEKLGINDAMWKGEISL